MQALELETNKSAQRFFKILDLAHNNVANFYEAGRALREREAAQANPFVGMESILVSEKAIAKAMKELNAFTSGEGKTPEEESKERQARSQANFKQREAQNSRAIAMAKQNKENIQTINKLELDNLNIQREALVSQKKYIEEESDRIKNKTAIYELDTAILLKEQEILENANAWTQTIAELRDEMKSSQEVWKGFIKSSLSSATSDLSGALTGIATGFPEQKAQAEELKVELESLEEQYKEAIGEGRIEDAKELKDQMGGLKDNINDLEDPVKNMGNAFKDFFKGVIEQAQSAIQELIAMELVALAIGNDSNTGSGSGGGWLSSLWGGVSGAVSNLWAGATGGVMPQVKSFRSFSQGGLTGNPTMAILGDNASSKELVIPSENISSNKVEGYTREKGDKAQEINIINVMTQDDVIQALASSKGEKAIINMIGRDMNTRGPMWKQIKSN